MPLEDAPLIEDLAEALLVASHESLTGAMKGLANVEAATTGAEIGCRGDGVARAQDLVEDPREATTACLDCVPEAGVGVRPLERLLVLQVLIERPGVDDVW